MAKVTMKLEGMEALQRALKVAPDVVKVHASSAVQASAFAVAQRARSLVPVQTGALKSAIVTTGKGLTGRAGIAPGVHTGRMPQLYASRVEFGTAHSAAQPFMRPAADSESDDFIRRMRDIGPKLERDLSTGRFL